MEWKLIDTNGNVYELGTPKEIVKHIDVMVSQGKYTKRGKNVHEPTLNRRLFVVPA